MKTVIIGAGVAGSVLADLLSKRGHTVTVLEMDSRPGGMCKSYYKEGFVYEYGPHILAMHNCSEKSAAYIKSKIEAERTELTTASSINGTLTYYPPSVHSAELLGLAARVKEEIAALPAQPDESNFKTYLISKVGKTLYELFFDSFTRKFWGIEPENLSAEWAKTRRLGENLTSKRMFFNEKWCAYPKKDWNELFVNLLRDIRVLYDVEVRQVDLVQRRVRLAGGRDIPFDFVISTMHVDQLFDQRFGTLKYAGYRIDPVILDRKSFGEFDGRPVSMTYFPGDDAAYCRVSDYGTFQQKTDYPYNERTIVTYEYPDHTKRLYPFTDKENMLLFDKYLAEAAKSPHLLTFGRMGLYKYLTSDTTVEMAFRALDVLTEWPAMSPEKRYQAYKHIRGDWSN